MMDAAHRKEYLLWPQLSVLVASAIHINPVCKLDPGNAVLNIHL